MAVDEVKAEDVKAQKTAILQMDEQWLSEDDEESPANERDEFEKQQQKNEMFVKALRDEHYAEKVDPQRTQKWLDSYIPLLDQLLLHT